MTVSSFLACRPSLRVSRRLPRARDSGRRVLGRRLRDGRPSPTAYVIGRDGPADPGSGTGPVRRLGAGRPDPRARSAHRRCSSWSIPNQVMNAQPGPRRRHLHRVRYGRPLARLVDVATRACRARSVTVSLRVTAATGTSPTVDATALRAGSSLRRAGSRRRSSRDDVDEVHGTQVHDQSGRGHHARRDVGGLREGPGPKRAFLLLRSGRHDQRWLRRRAHQPAAVSGQDSVTKRGPESRVSERGRARRRRPRREPGDRLATMRRPWLVSPRHGRPRRRALARLRDGSGRRSAAAGVLERRHSV